MGKKKKPKDQIEENVEESFCCVVKMTVVYLLHYIHKSSVSVY